MSDTIFCCPSSGLMALGSYRSHKDHILWYFARCMSDLVTLPSFSSSSPSTSSLTSAATCICPPSLLAAILNNSLYVIQFEKWINGEREVMRWFIPHPGRECAFIELEREVVRAGGWEWGWAYMKLGCQHWWDGVMYVVKMLERVEEGARKVKDERVEDAEDEGEAAGLEFGQEKDMDPASSSEDEKRGQEG